MKQATSPRASTLQKNQTFFPSNSTNIVSKDQGSLNKQLNLNYLLIINKQNEPLFFKSYSKQQCSDDLNIQLHCYACLDFIDQKWIQKSDEFLGPVYTIYNLSGQYSIYAFYTVTKIKILGVFKLKVGQAQYNQNKIKSFFIKTYKLYKKQLYQPFQNSLNQNKFSKKFHYQLDLLASTSQYK